KTIDDLPDLILSENLFSKFFNVWERPILKLVCKRWKILMPYADLFLDFDHVCKKMSETMHKTQGMIRDRHSVENCYLKQSKAKNLRFLRKGLEQLLVVRKMGKSLKTLHFNVRRVKLDLVIASFIVENCVKLQNLKINFKFADPKVCQLLLE